MSEKIVRSKEEILELNQELSILNTISQSVNQSVDLDEILNRSLDKIMEMTAIRSAGVYLLGEKSQELIYVAHRGFSKRFIKGMKRIQLGEGITGKVALSGESEFIEDYPNFPEALPLAIEEGLKSLAVIPLKSRDKVYGTLNIAWKEFRPFSPAEKNLFHSISQILSSAMERASLYTENVKRLEEEKILHAISREIASRLELKVILEIIIENAVNLLGAEAGDLTLWDPHQQHYSISIVYRLPETLIGKEIFPPLGIRGEVLEEKRSVLYPNYENHPERLRELDADHFKEFVGVPLK